MKSSDGIKKLLCDLHLLTGMRVSLHSLEFDEISAYPESVSGFCSFVQKNPKARLQCGFTDRDAFERAKHSGKPYIYRCRFGLLEAVFPLYKNGTICGYLMAGQALVSENEISDAFESALPYVTDKEELQKRLASLPTVSAERIRAFSDIVLLCAGHIADQVRMTEPSSAELSSSVMQYINRNIGKKLTLGDICKTFNCSKSTLTKLFKRDCGVTVNEYIISQRIAIARELLQYTEQPIGRIAEKCGFSDQLYFSKVFSARVGVSPTRYRSAPFGKGR